CGDRRGSRLGRRRRGARACPRGQGRGRAAVDPRCNRALRRRAARGEEACGAGADGARALGVRPRRDRERSWVANAASRRPRGRPAHGGGRGRARAPCAGRGRARPLRSRPATLRLLGRLVRDVRARRAFGGREGTAPAGLRPAGEGARRGAARRGGCRARRPRARGARLPAPLGARARLRLARGAAHRAGVGDGDRGGDGRRARARLVRGHRGCASRAGRARDAGRLRDSLGPRARAVTSGRVTGGQTKGASMTGRRVASGLVLAAVAAAAAKKGPDLQYFWGGIWSLEDAWAGSTKPVSDYIPASELKHYLNTAEDTYNGKVWTAGWYVQPSFPVLYRKDVLAKAGVKPPQTWAQLLAACDRLNAKGIT